MARQSGDWTYLRSSLIRSVLIAKAASAPSDGRDDHPLDGARGVAGDEEPAQVGGLVLAGVDGPLLVELAAESGGQRGLLVLAGGEEQRAARGRLTPVEDDALQDAVAAFEPDAPRSSTTTMPLRERRSTWRSASSEGPSVQSRMSDDHAVSSSDRP